MTTDTFTLTTYPPTKKDIIHRLFTNELITFDEMWTLLQDEPEVRYIPMPQAPFNPWPLDPYYTTAADGTINNQGLHFTSRTAADNLTSAPDRKVGFNG